MFGVRSQRMAKFSSCSLRLVNTKFRKFFSKCSSFKNVEKLSTPIQACPVEKIISERIKTTGSITVADFMKEVLVHPLSGYYTSKDTIERTSDFISTPEVNQMFGEMIASWFISEWLKIGAPQPLNLMELGPGLGTMMSNILKTFHKLKADKHLTVYMMEVSEVLAKIQAKNIGVTLIECSPDEACYMKGKTKNDVPVCWFKECLDTQVRGFTFVVGREFFSVLPIHKFQRTSKGWREIMIDFDENDGKFKNVLSSDATSGTKRLIDENDARNEFEICPDGLEFMEIMADRMERYGGLTLIIDFGHTGTKTDTFKAFQKQQPCDPLLNIGNAKLAAEVDFSALKKISGEKLISYGPITQQQFLKQMNIDGRMKDLMQNAPKEQKQHFKSDYHMLMDNDKMGSSLQVLAFFPAVLEEFLNRIPPLAFREDKS